MGTTVTPEFEKLCDREFEFVSGEAYDGLDQEIGEIKEHCNVGGCLMSSATGQTVKAAVLARFDRVLAAFDNTYLAKWRDDPSRALSDEDEAWLRQKANSSLEAAANEAERQCNVHLWEPSLFFARYWGETGIEARLRIGKFRQKIEILKLRKDQQPVKQRVQPTANPFEG